MPRLLLTLLLIPILLACTGDEISDDGSPSDAPAAATSSERTADISSASETPAATDAATGEPSQEPGGPEGDILDERLAFVLGVLNGAPLDDVTFEEAFAPVFRDQLTLEQLTTTLGQVTPLAPFTLGEERSRQEGGLAIDVVGADGTQLIITLNVDSAGQIAGLLLSPGETPALEDPVSSLDDAIERLSAMGQLHLAASTVTAGECTTDVGVAAAEPAPIGSAFKLYVLGAVVDAIDAGELAWTDALTITEEVRSLPSGVLQDREEGAEVTVQEAAELMISISDNTATDLLLHAVGRQAVEAAQAAWGHSAPQLNTPFLTTRELFLLKAAPDEVQQAWVDGAEAERRAILDDIATDDLPPITLFGTDPIRPDDMEWFASPEDLCRVLAQLHERFGAPGMEPLEGILTANPGVPDADGRWQQILFKGGSEPGLIATAFLVTDDQGDVYALTSSVLNPRAALDDVDAVLLMAAARDLLPAG